jgi:ATP-dependent helicase Lhr and Lhr-like helicase
VFERFHPHLRHAIVNDLGWRGLRPVQELAGEAILDGANVVVLAPTAGGKTEASIFPVLSRILTEELGPVAALYVCPIRALLNNQEERLQKYARMVGLDAFKWHGDVGPSARRRFLEQPTHMLMITPESLEVILMSKREEAKQLFASLSMVIIDEVHAFAGDDRGAHLVSVLERLVHFCERDIQRIGLSATVGNPDEIGTWLQGSSEREYRRIDPPKPPALRDFHIDVLEDGTFVAAEAARLAQGKKSLVFVEARSEAERISGAMAGRGVEVFVHHSAVSRADRQVAEERFTSGQNTAIVCTSTMELGIDVGDLDLVLQVDAPSSVASMLQRTGRTGRRPGTRSNCTFLCKSPETLLQATALLRLLERGFVEDVRPVRAAAHVLAHQIMALTLQEGGISRHAVLPWIAAASPFTALSQAEVDSLVNTMLEREILYESDGLLSLGKEGERVYGRKNFFELYAVFSSPSVLRVEHGGTEVGTIQATFLDSADETNPGAFCFRLAGRAWRVERVDRSKGYVAVVPAEAGKVPAWIGSPTGLSWTLCQEMKATLAATDQPPWLSHAGAAELANLRRSYDGLVSPGEAPLESTADGVVWHTFAGAAVNRLLGAGIEQAGSGKPVVGNLSVRLRGPSAAAASHVVACLKDVDWEVTAHTAARATQSSSVSKFQRCLPVALEEKLLSERTYDSARTKALVESFRFPAS